MPIMGLVTMPAAAVSVVLMPLKLDVLPLYVMGWGINAMLGVGRFVSRLPGAISNIPAWPIFALVLVSLGGLWIVIWRGNVRWLGLICVAAAAFVIFLSRPPDLLVARDGITVAVRAQDGRLILVRRPADLYSATEWLKRDGDTRKPADAVARSSDPIRCDAYGCVAIVGTRTRVAFTLQRDGLAEDCAAADVVISAIPVRGSCAGPKLVIDHLAVSRNGAYAVWLGDPIHLATVQGVRGDRPWSREPWAKRYRLPRLSSGG
jgi:competence protein ComEC